MWRLQKTSACGSQCTLLMHGLAQCSVHAHSQSSIRRTVSQLAVVAPPLAAATLQQLRRCAAALRRLQRASVIQVLARPMVWRASAIARP